MTIKNRAKVNFYQDLKTNGCPVCNYVNEIVLDFFSQWVHSFAKRPDVQDEHAAGLGFCSFHTWRLESAASARGISAGYPKLLERLARDLSNIARSSDNLEESVKELIKQRDDCPICTLMLDSEKYYVEQLAGFLRGDEGRKAYEGSQGVCLHHLAMLQASLPEKQTGAYLLMQAARRFSEMAEDMRSFARKYDALERYLLTRKERNACSCALIHVAGLRWLSTS